MVKNVGGFSRELPQFVNGSVWWLPYRWETQTSWPRKHLPNLFPLTVSSITCQEETDQLCQKSKPYKKGYTKYLHYLHSYYLQLQEEGNLTYFPVHTKSPLRSLITYFMDGRTGLKLWELPTAQKRLVHSHRRRGLNLSPFKIFSACCSKKTKQTVFDLAPENHACCLCIRLLQPYREVWQIFSCGADWKRKQQGVFLKPS